MRTNVEGQASGTCGEGTPVPFDVCRVDHPLGVVLTLRGELDLATAPELQEQLDRVMPGRGTVVIDLSELEFIDSSGLYVLVRAEQQLRASGRQLVLERVPPAVRRVFEVVGLDGYFKMSDSFDATRQPELDCDLRGAAGL